MQLLRAGYPVAQKASPAALRSRLRGTGCDQQGVERVARVRMGPPRCRPWVFCSSQAPSIPPSTLNCRTRFRTVHPHHVRLGARLVGCPRVGRGRCATRARSQETEVSHRRMPSAGVYIAAGGALPQGEGSRAHRAGSVGLCAPHGDVHTRLAMQVPHAGARRRASAHAAPAPPPRLRRWPLKLNLMWATPSIAEASCACPPHPQYRACVHGSCLGSQHVWLCTCAAHSRHTALCDSSPAACPRCPLQICAVHIKAPHVAIDGRDMRFCQK